MFSLYQIKDVPTEVGTPLREFRPLAKYLVLEDQEGKEDQEGGGEDTVVGKVATVRGLRVKLGF